MAYKTVDRPLISWRFDGMGIANSNTEVGLSPQAFAKFAPQCVMNRLPNPFALLLSGVFVDRLLGRKVVGPHLPLAPGSLESCSYGIADCIHAQPS